MSIDKPDKHNIDLAENSWMVGERMKIGFPTIYNYLVDKGEGVNLFSNRFNLLCFGMVYGILINKKIKTQKRSVLGPILDISEPQIRDMFNFCYMILDDGRSKDEIITEMWDYADGGVTELNKIYEENGSFNLPSLIRDAEKIWVNRVKDLQNINLKK